MVVVPYMVISLLMWVLSTKILMEELDSSVMPLGFAEILSICMIGFLVGVLWPVTGVAFFIYYVYKRGDD